MKDQNLVEMSANPNGEGGGEGESMGIVKGEKTFWDKVLDKKEAKDQVLFALPMILTNAFYYLITLVSVMFAGHLGHLHLASATLANSWATVTGFAFMVTLPSSLSRVLVFLYSSYIEFGLILEFFIELSCLSIRCTKKIRIFWSNGDL